MLYRLGVLLLGLLAMGPVIPDAWAEKVGPVFRANTYTLGAQWDPAVAALTHGGFVVTWSSRGQDATSSDFGIYGQRYAADGARIGREFRVNTRRKGHQDEPAVAGLPDGRFVVVWESWNADGYSRGIFGQRYEATGERLGDEFRISTNTRNIQQQPSVAPLDDGGFVVVWSSGEDGFSRRIYGQRYSQAGARLGSEFLVSANPRGYLYQPCVSRRQDGGFLVTWTSSASDGFAAEVYGQIFSDTGTRVRNEFRVNTERIYQQADSAVAVLNSGRMVVVWNSLVIGFGYEIHGQLYSAAGRPLGEEFRINTYRTNDQWVPAIAPLSNGGFIVAWGSKGQVGSPQAVYGRRYDRVAQEVGAEFRISTPSTAREEGFPSVARLTNGEFVVIWTIDRGGGSADVYGQRFKP